MDSRKVPALLVFIGVVVAVVLFLVLKDDTADEDATLPGESALEAESAPDDEEGEEGGGGSGQRQRPDRPDVPTIEVEGGRPVGGVQDIEFEAGASVRIDVRADQPDELHLHGYDLTFDVPRGRTRTIEFEAELEGLFELESHTTGAVLAKISIVPS